ncbi:SusC/RagA family TonB-linked outer membrane protein [Arsenicibacter rosenii]|uniref:SusC/RagA family protein n=1 Tax=Arsenicibacter rosenii TaxID=1750698 RepID=A0A1S2VFR7_9BACT|nr:TonB-dependent receptor [Arsenicibacter rosenii]OIN57554.1 SusC/RagA family protein [Arsenicibacter rosenii]
MIKKLLMTVVMLLVITAGFAQQTRQIAGRVKDGSTGGYLPGVSVIVKGTTAGTTTDADGKFTLRVPDRNDLTLTFSFIGYTSQQVAVGRQTSVEVTLESDQKTLDEVVVVGYATVNRRDVTGSVSSVNAKQLKDIPLTDAAQALTGRLAGVRVTTSEGAPGADIQIRIRGGGSITQDNSPIYVVDGIQVENALSFISPQDIETIDVLKDASTTAIYGARGANGVVIITTKSGKNGKTTVSYNGSAGFREISKTLDVMNPYDFVRWQYERSRGDATAETSFARLYGTWDAIDQYKTTTPINWQEEIFGRKAQYQNHNVNVNGGNANTNYNLSLTANKEDGVLLESGFERYLATFKMDHKANDKLRLGFNVRYLNQTIRGAGTTNSGTKSTNRLRHSIQYRPLLTAAQPDVDDFDEDLYISSGNLVNPILMTQAEYRRAYTKALNMSGYASYNITKNLTFKTTVGLDNNDQQINAFWSKITSTARNYASLPVASINQIGTVTINNSNVLQYSQKFGKKHDFTALVGQEIYDNSSKSTGIETRYFPADISADQALANMGLGSPPSGAAQPRPTSNIVPPNRLFSLFGRVTYGYDDKYLATVSLRSDRSSKFNYANGALVFPSGTLAWRFSKEEFFKKQTVLSDGKIRFGYGVAGNNRIGDLLYQQLYGVTGEYALNHAVLPGYAPIALANPDLKWESNVSQNLGIDLSFLNNRFQVSLDAYKNQGRNLLLAVAIPPTSGYSSQIKNLGSTMNKGLELQMTAYVVQRKNVSWTSNFNISANRNKVTSLGTVSQLTRNSGWQGSDGADDYLVKVGESVGLMYGFVTDGFYTVDDFTYNETTKAYTIKPGIAYNSVYGVPQPGMLKWKDIDGDGQITADKDRTVIGNANPKFIGGWNNQVTYKNFDFSVFVNWVVGNDIYNANKIEFTDGAFPNLNMLSMMKNRWTNLNDAGQIVTDPAELKALNANATIWTPVRVQRYWLHSWAVEDGSFLRLNNITLGYTLPATISKKVGMSRFRAYATVNNLATLTKYSGFDPEVSTRRSDPLTQGVDYAGYPRAKTWVFGVNVTF